MGKIECITSWNRTAPIYDVVQWAKRRNEWYSKVSDTRSRRRGCERVARLRWVWSGERVGGTGKVSDVYYSMWYGKQNLPHAIGDVGHVGTLGPQLHADTGNILSSPN